MKLIKIKHYVKNSFMNSPAFVLEMSDGKDYISDIHRFVEYNESNIEKIIEAHECKDYIKQLLNSSSIEMEDITDARHI